MFRESRPDLRLAFFLTPLFPSTCHFGNSCLSCAEASENGLSLHQGPGGHARHGAPTLRRTVAGHDPSLIRPTSNLLVLLFVSTLAGTRGFSRPGGCKDFVGGAGRAVQACGCEYRSEKKQEEAPRFRGRKAWGNRRIGYWPAHYALTVLRLMKCSTSKIRPTARAT